MSPNPRAGHPTGTPASPRRRSARNRGQACHGEGGWDATQYGSSPAGALPRGPRARSPEGAGRVSHGPTGSCHCPVCRESKPSATELRGHWNAKCEPVGLPPRGWKAGDPVPTRLLPDLARAWRDHPVRRLTPAEKASMDAHHQCYKCFRAKTSGWPDASFLMKPAGLLYRWSLTPQSLRPWPLHLH